MNIYLGGDGINPFVSHVAQATRGTFLFVTDREHLKREMKERLALRFGDDATVAKDRVKINNRTVMLVCTERQELHTGFLIEAGLIFGDFGYEQEKFMKVYKSMERMVLR